MIPKRKFKRSRRLWLGRDNNNNNNKKQPKTQRMVFKLVDRARINLMQIGYLNAATTHCDLTMSNEHCSKRTHTNANQISSKLFVVTHLKRSLLLLLFVWHKHRSNYRIGSGRCDGNKWTIKVSAGCAQVHRIRWAACHASYLLAGQWLLHAFRASSEIRKTNECIQPDVWSMGSGY